MPTYFANPLGFLALLGIPAVLLIHFLREKSRRVPASTLFLLERLTPRTPRGRTFHFLQNSTALWLQLLIVLLCAWLLAQPRWVRANSAQQVVVILDSTASMSAFVGQVAEELPRYVGDLSKAAAHTQWTVMTTDRPETPLFRGAEASGVPGALVEWRPALPYHDPARAFSLAQLEARGGTILFVTDRQPESLPAGVSLLALGRPIANCGFVGVKVWSDADGAHWEALVKNASESAQERDWWMETETVRTQPQKLRLAPGEIATIPGPFPSGEHRAVVRLSQDEFALDDVLPLTVPEPKPLSVHVGAASLSEFMDKVVATLPGAKRVSDAASADVQVLSGAVDPDSAPSAVWLAVGAVPDAKADLNPITAEPHPLMEGLVWDGLLSPGPREFAMGASDRALLWQSDRPLVLLRSRPRGAQLIVNFDFEHSNANRLPAFVLLLSRFFASAQDRKLAHFSDNFETHQVLSLGGAKGAELILANGKAEPRPDEGVLRAPLEPGGFRVRSGTTELLEGAAHFGDPREGDFHDAGASVSSLAAAARARRENTVGDRFAALWLALIGAALAGSWIAQNRVAETGGSVR